MTDTPERILYLDLLRVCAILMVVVSHVFAPVCAAMNDYPPRIWWVFNLADSVIRNCVPLFIMISGNLLLGSSRQEPYVDSVAKRWAKVLPPFFIWHMIYRCVDARIDGGDFAPGAWVLDFLRGSTEYHLYFMYIILGLYLVMPFLRRWVRAAGPGDLSALILLWLGYLTLQFFFPAAYASSGPAATLLGYGGYFVLGYVLGQTGIYRGKALGLACVCLAIVVFNAGATYKLSVGNTGPLDEKFYAGLTPLVALYSACFFLLVKRLAEESALVLPPRMRRLITTLSKESFNLYLIHVLFLTLLTNGCFGFVLSERTGGSPFIGVPVTAALVLAASLALSWLLRKIPVLSKGLVIPAG